MFRPEALAARTQPKPDPTPVGLRRWSGTITAWFAGTLFSLVLLAAALIPSPEVIRGRAVVRYGDLRLARSPSAGVVGQLFVSPGDEVRTGDPIALLASPRVNAAFETSETNYRDAVRRMLRAPENLGARTRVGETWQRLQTATRERELQIVRAPESGVVLALRTHVGASIQSLAEVCEIRTGPAPASLVVLFEGNERPRIQRDARLRVVFDAFPKAPLKTEVDSVADNILSPQDAAAFTSSYVSAGFSEGSSVVTVHAPLEVDERARERGLNLYEGMTADVELVVRDRSVLARLLSPGGLL